MPTVYYRALLEPDDSGGHGVIFPDLPGCVSAGDDAADAVRMAGEALALHVEGSLEDGDVPPPAALDAPLPDWLLEEPGAERMVRVLVPVDVPSKPVRVDLSLEEELVAQIDSVAAVRGMTRSAFLAERAGLLLARWSVA